MVLPPRKPSVADSFFFQTPLGGSAAAEDEGFESPSGGKRKATIVLFYNPNVHVPTPIRVRSRGHRFSHGLKIARQLSIFTPVRALVPPFRILRILCQKKKTRCVSSGHLFLAEDEGFEPPQTESESGVLPLHKSSIC